MNFLNGVILIKEIMSLSIVGIYIMSGMLIILTAMSVGGMVLHIDGQRHFSTWREIGGLIISFTGLGLLLALWLVVRDNSIIPIADKFGLAEYTGEYEVTVTADTDMNEFQEHYDIIDYENGVYTIKVKEI